MHHVPSAKDIQQEHGRGWWAASDATENDDVYFTIYDDLYVLQICQQLGDLFPSFLHTFHSNAMENSPNDRQEIAMDIKAEASEFEGNTVDEAINKAVQQLGIPKSKLKIKIVCEEKRGLFGMQGAKTAKIKVTPKP